MKLLFICLLLTCSSLINTYGQQTYIISGLVRDSTTNQPLQRAAVVIDYEKFTSGTYTDANGRFSISVKPGKRIVVVRLIGYLPFRSTVNVRANVELDIRMPSVASQLEEVIVTSKGFDRTVRQPLLGVNQINIKTLRRMPAALGEVDILRSLQMLPGVTSVGEAANGVNIRGGTTDQTLMLLDDTPIFNPTHMFGLFSVYPPDAVNGLDLYKGNVPARFGGRAASVLDVSLKNPDLNQAQLSGGVSLVSNRLTVDVPIIRGKIGLLVSGRGAFNDFLLPLGSQKLNNIKAKFGDGTAKLFWRMNDRNTLTAMGYFSTDFFQTNLLGSIANINSVATQFDHQTLNGMVRWFRLINSRLNLQTTALFARYEPKLVSIEPSNNPVTLKQAVFQRQVKSNVNYVNTSHKLEAGLSATHYQLNPGELLPGQSQSVHYQKTPQESAAELAIHAEDEVNVNKQFAFSVGIRYSHFLNLGPSVINQYKSGQLPDETTIIDSTYVGKGQISKQYGGLEPRIGIRYALNERSSIKVGYNLMRQYLQVVTNTTTPLPTARWKTSDRFIKPQVSQLFSAGWFQQFKDNIFELSAEVYWRSTQNIIDYKPGANFLLQQYPETQLLQGRNKSYGMEAMITKKKGELTGWINYTYSRSLNQVLNGSNFREQINGGDWYRANYDRPHSLNASLNINQTKHHSFSFNFAYSTGRPYTAPEGFIRYQGRTYPYYNQRNMYRIPDYHRLDFAWHIYNPSMKARRWQGHWTFTIYNIYARRNAYSVYFKTEGQATNPYRLVIFGAPIPSLSYNFELK